MLAVHFGQHFLTRSRLFPRLPTRQADGTGSKLVAPTAPAGTNLAAQFSITWEDIPPSKIGELQAAAFKAAILKQLPAGGVRLGQSMAWSACIQAAGSARPICPVRLVHWHTHLLASC